MIQKKAKQFAPVPNDSYCLYFSKTQNKTKRIERHRLYKANDNCIIQKDKQWIREPEQRRQSGVVRKPTSSLSITRILELLNKIKGRERFR